MRNRQCTGLHPKEERDLTSSGNLDSHRRLDLAAQFQTAKLVIFGLQKTSLAVARALGIGLYQTFAAATNKSGQGGIELWVLRAWLRLSHPFRVFHTSHRILMVRLLTIVGPIQILVAHALDSSYPPDQIAVWWKELGQLLDACVDKDVLTMWPLDANVTVGSEQSSAVGPRHPETEPAAGSLFHAQLRRWGNMSL